jgi:hypothetical protein
MKTITILLFVLGGFAAVLAAVAATGALPASWSPAVHGGEAGLVALITYLGARGPQVFGKAAGVAVLVIAGFSLTGCLSSAPLVPVTSANQAQVTSCENTASMHNGVVVGGFVLSGGTAGLAGVAAAEPDSNGSAKTALGVAGAIVGGAAIIDAAVAELTNSNFQNGQCSSVVGALPTAPSPAGQ